MKIKLFCNKCEEPACAESNKIMVVVPHGKQYSIEITDKLLYEFSCENGHLNRFFITNPKYELLFDMGLCAYLNGLSDCFFIGFQSCSIFSPYAFWLR